MPLTTTPRGRGTKSMQTPRRSGPPSDMVFQPQHRSTVIHQDFGRFVRLLHPVKPKFLPWVRRQERAIGWYYYLEGKLDFPFLARCAARGSTSPLKVGDEVEVIGRAPVEECEHEMFVELDWDEEELAVPLSQLEVIDADEGTRVAVEDWLYWTKKGYQF
jgi:Calcium binding